MLNNQSSGHYTRVFFIFILAGMLGTCFHGCKNKESFEIYHRFQDRSWARFNILSFEIPVKKVEKPYDVYLFARFSSAFEHESLEFNMIMNTPAGEERIAQYTMNVRSKSGKFPGDCSGDSCQGSILLQRELNLSKPGILKIEIENLIPHMTTEGVMGVGIRLIQSGK